MGNKISLKYLNLRFCIIMITVMFIGNMLAIAGISMPMRLVQYTVTYCWLFGASLLFIVHSSARSNALMVNTTCFSVLIISVTIIAYYDYGLSTLFNLVTRSTFWAMALIAGYSFGFKKENSVKKSLLITAFIPLMFFLFTLVDKYLERSEDRAMITSAYYLICLFPFVAVLKNKVWKDIFVILILTAALLCGKRGGFIAFSICFVAYMFFKLSNSNKKIASFLGTIIIVLSMYYILQYVVKVYDFSIFNRIANIQEDQGSGRIDIYREVWHLIKSMDLFPQLFGRGFNKVYSDLGRNLSAHNDFLEVIYDYGIIGFALYLNMYRILIKYARRLLRQKSEYAPAFISAIVIMLVLSMVSHLIIYNTYFIYLCLFFGLVVGDYDRQERERLCKQ